MLFIHSFLFIKYSGKTSFVKRLAKIYHKRRAGSGKEPGVARRQFQTEANWLRSPCDACGFGAGFFPDEGEKSKTD